MTKSYEPKSIELNDDGSPAVETVGKAGWIVGQGVVFVPEGTGGYFAGAVKGDEESALVRDDTTGEWVIVSFDEIASA